MKSSCISHPKNQQYVIIHQWQTEFCEGNQCAAALLSFFEYWHNWKLMTAGQNDKSQNVCQSHTLQELSTGMLGLFGRSAIIYALKWLENKNAIIILSNANEKDSFSKVKTYKFNPDVCNSWLRQQKLCNSNDNNIVNYRENTPKLNEEIRMLSFNEIVPQVDEKSKEMIQNIADALMQISKYYF